jgi:hypothetical protein
MVTRCGFCPIVNATPDADEVAAALMTTVVAFVTEEMYAFAGIDPPLIGTPTSLAVNDADADVTVVVAFVTPSETLRFCGSTT